MSGEPVMLFDGKCNFCSGAVHFFLDHERAPEFLFAPLQSDAALERVTAVVGDSTEAARLIEEAQGFEHPTLIVIDGGKLLRHSTAVLRLARTLRAPWSWAAAGWIVPRPIRDLLYNWVARNRIRLFGKAETCRVPTPELRARFLGEAR